MAERQTKLGQLVVEREPLPSPGKEKNDTSFTHVCPPPGLTESKLDTSSGELVGSDSLCGGMVTRAIMANV